MAGVLCCAAVLHRASKLQLCLLIACCSLEMSLVCSSSLLYVPRVKEPSQAASSKEISSTGSPLVKQNVVLVVAKSQSLGNEPSTLVSQEPSHLSPVSLPRQKCRGVLFSGSWWFSSSSARFAFDIARVDESFPTRELRKGYPRCVSMHFCEEKLPFQMTH